MEKLIPNETKLQLNINGGGGGGGGGYKRALHIG